MTFSNPGHHSRISLEVMDTHRLKIKCGDFLFMYLFIFISFYLILFHFILTGGEFTINTFCILYIFEDIICQKILLTFFFFG